MSRRTLKSSPLSFRSLLIGALLISTAALSSCNTTAVITIGSTNFANVKSSGMTLKGNTLEQCTAPTSATNRLMTRMVLMGTSDGRSSGTVALRKGDEVDGTILELKADNIRFAADSSVAAFGSNSCSNCTAYPGLECTASTFTPGSGKWCQATKAFTSGTPEFLSRNETGEKQLFALLFENTASIRGIGVAKSVKAPGIGVNALVRNLLVELNEVAKDDKERNEIETHMAIYGFNSQMQDKVEYFPSKGTSFIEPSSAQAAIRQFTSSLKNTEQSVYTKSRSNLFEALDELLSSDTLGASQPTLKSAKQTYKEVVLFVFVDGPNEKYTTDKVFKALADKLANQKIRTFIVHVDPPLVSLTTNGDPTQAELDKLFPPFGEKECSADTDCLTYQRCEKYTGSPDASKKYCIVKRNKKGQTGPIDQYSQLACLTGGGYFYIPATLKQVLGQGSSPLDPSWTPWALSALWEVPVGVGGGLDSVLKRGQYQIGTEMKVKVGGQEKSLPLLENDRAAVVVK